MQKLRGEIYIDDTFPYERVFEASQDLIPWLTNFANFLACYFIPKDLSFQ